MGVAGLAGAGLAGQDGGEGPVALLVASAGWAGGQALEGGLDGGEVVEGVEAVGAAAEFAGGLRAAEEEEAEDGGLVAAEVEDGADAVLVLGDAGVADRGDEGEVFVELRADRSGADFHTGRDPTDRRGPQRRRGGSLERPARSARGGIRGTLLRAAKRSRRDRR